MDHFAIHESYRIEWHKFNAADLQQKLPDIQFMYGHAPYSQLTEFSQGFKRVTFLRDPIARVLSEQRYVLDKIHIEPDVKAVRIDHFLPPVGDPIDMASNVACKMLSRLDPFDPTIPMERHLESAKEVLVNDFDFVGITERMDESIQLFCDLIGLEKPDEVPVHNTTESKRPPYPQSILDGIAERNRFDQELYQFAQEIFEEQIQQRIALNFKIQPIEWRSEIVYDFREALDGYGWCPRECWGEDVFRWLSSSEMGCIRFSLLPQDYILELELFTQPKLLRKFMLFSNGTRLPYRIVSCDRISGEYRWFMCRAFLPKTCISFDKKTEITLSILDPTFLHPKDSYRGRCGSRRILLRPM